MQRKKQILLVSHCILNQNTVIENEARAEGAVLSATAWATKQGFGIVQLPCPEFTFLGLNRPPMTYDEYNTPEYRKHCREILTLVLNQSKEYLMHGYELAGVLGIQSSPSCDPNRGRGVFIEELNDLFAENGIALKTLWYLPNTGDPIFNGDLHHL
jgi:predicted secreted protein